MAGVVSSCGQSLLSSAGLLAELTPTLQWNELSLLVEGVSCLPGGCQNFCLGPQEASYLRCECWKLAPHWEPVSPPRVWGPLGLPTLVLPSPLYCREPAGGRCNSLGFDVDWIQVVCHFGAVLLSDILPQWPDDRDEQDVALVWGEASLGLNVCSF